MADSNQSYEALIKNVNEELQKLSIWFRSNNLSLNVTKTQYMMFGKRYVQNCKVIMLNNEKLTQVHEVKFLGVYIDSKLNWKYHINITSNKIACNLSIINKIHNKVSLSLKNYVIYIIYIIFNKIKKIVLLKIMYNVLIQLHLYYYTII